MPLNTPNNFIDDKLAKDLYRAAPTQNSVAPNISTPKITLQRFQALEQQIKNNPANAQPYRELAEIYFEQNRWKDARRVLEQGVRHNPEDEQLLTMFEDSRLRLSREAMDAAVKNFEWQKSETARKELDQSELELAAMQFEIAEARFARHPEQYDLLVMSAVALNRLGRPEEAIDRFQIAAKQPTTRAVASLNLGVCFEERGQIVEALSAYRRAALFRSPAPPLETKQRALKLAMQLAQKNQLYDSAIRFLDLMAQSEEESDALKLVRSDLVRKANAQKIG